MAFPTWPPPSGGYPVLTGETGPITSPFPYGGSQPTSINIAPPVPVHPYPGTFYPQKIGVTGGQNQNQSLPAWPHSKVNVLPDKASPSISAISPTPPTSPSSVPVHLTQSQIGRLGPVNKTFPAGSYLNGYGSLITPTGVVRTIGGLGS